jgi:hypothetical protein
LALTASPDESQVFASGTDNSVTCIQKLHSESEQQTPSQYRRAYDNVWAYNSSHRPHTHDILSLAVVSMPTNNLDNALVKQSQSPLRSGVVMVSGGVDCKLCIYSVSDFAKTRPTFILPVPAHGLMCASDKSANATSLLVSKHESTVDLWSLSMHQQRKKKDQQAIKGAAEEQQTPKKSKKGSKRAAEAEPVAVDTDHSDNDQAASASQAMAESGSGCSLEMRIESANEDFVHNVCLSSNGHTLAVTRLSGLTLYNVSRVGVEGSAEGASVISKIPVPEDVDGVFFQCMAFNAEGNSLALCANGYIVIIDIDASGQSNTARYRCTINHRTSVSAYVNTVPSSAANDLAMGLHNAISSCDFSADCSYLVVTDSLRSVYI